MGLSIQITGLDEILKKFETVYSENAINAILHTSLVTSSTAVLSELQANTPVDTGKLRDSEYIDYAGDGITAFVGPGPGLQPHYAADQEYGFHHWISGKFIQGYHYVEKTTIVMTNVVESIFRNNFEQLLS